MVARIDPKELSLLIKFGGGLHTRASEDEIDPREAADGGNFLLDLENRELRPRPPFDLIGTVPNASEIRGGGSLLKSDGTVSTLIQAGTTVYQWDGATGFTSVGTVSSGTKLRGHWRSHSWTLDDLLILTDVTLTDVVKFWNGTTFGSINFADELGAAFGTFAAKYLSIENERAVFSNIRDAGGTFPHLIVGSLRSQFFVITTGNRPSSALSAEDPFFLVAPDLKPINGHIEAFGTTIISTEKGKLYKLNGVDATDFAFDDFYPGSSASGDEAMSYIGNDIIYGRQGRIESVRDTDRFGDTEADDMSRPIADQIAAYTGWRIVYNGRLNRAYLFPDAISEVWVLNTAMIGGEVSPWMRWTTAHALAFKPTFVMAMLDPVDGLEYVFMGDASGNFYRLEGTGAAGDAGANSIAVEWLTKLHSAPLDTAGYEDEGYIKYRKNEAVTASLNFEFTGIEGAVEQAVAIAIPALSGGSYFGGSAYFGGDFFFGIANQDKLVRQRFDVPGQAEDMQLRVTVDTVNTFAINEIGLRFKAASP